MTKRIKVVLSFLYLTAPLFFALALTLAQANAAPPATLTLFYENRPPFMFLQNGKLVGPEGKPPTDAFKAAGIDFTLTEAPGARELDWIQKNISPSCAIGIYKTAERLKFGKFTLPIYFKQSKVLVVRADNQRINSYTSWLQLLADPQISLVMRNGYSYGDKLDAMLAQAKARLKRPPEESHGRIKMVLKGMADGALFTPLEADYQIKEFGEEGASLKTMTLSDSPPVEFSYIYCSNSVDDGVINMLNDLLKKN